MGIYCQCMSNRAYIFNQLQLAEKISLVFLWATRHWCLPIALHVTRMNLKHKADIEHSLAMIEVMNQIKYVFCHGLLVRIIQDNVSPITVERVRQTTDISCQELKRQIIRMAHSVHVFNDRDVMVFGSILSVTSVESTTYHCCLSSPSTEAILQIPR
jgi:hypothetical protein